MNNLPVGLDECEVVEALRASWGLNTDAVTYVQVGFGSHHWDARLADGRRYFLTADDLDQKPWIGADRKVAFEGLRSAFDTALALYEQAHLDFVVPPIRTNDGDSVRRITPQYTLAVFPFMAGRSGHFGEQISGEERVELLRLLADLHQATPIVRSTAPRRGIGLPERPVLEAALNDLDQPWEGGPFAEPARKQLATYAEVALQWLESFDRLAEEVATSGHEQVITHGEPHGGNLIRAGGRLLLIDWDTVALAPPERDLWMLDSGYAKSLMQYAKATNRQVNQSAIALYRLVWMLSDIANFLSVFRSNHQRTEDTQLAWRAFTDYLRLEEPPPGSSE
ncbi:MAG: phosphotransferase [Thermaerobacter sp.]|nr:phosphotransferase [Thermaerobacter sp.]